MLECTCICYLLNVLQESKHRLLTLKKDNVKKNPELALQANTLTLFQLSVSACI